MPLGALSSLSGPRTFTGPSLTCATASLHSRRRQVRRRLQTVEQRRRHNVKRYRQILLGGRHCYVHPVVIQILLGRTLRRDEHVHHRDGDKLNNRPANLQLLSARAHAITTRARHPLVVFCPICGQPFIKRVLTRCTQQTCSVPCGRILSWRTRRANARC